MKRGVVVLWLKGLSNWFMVKGKGWRLSRENLRQTSGRTPHVRQHGLSFALLQQSPRGLIQRHIA